MLVRQLLRQIIKHKILVANEILRSIQRYPINTHDFVYVAVIESVF
jgi:hypothetical protein